MLKGIFGDFFTTQNSLISKAQTLHQSLLNGEINAIEIPQTILKLLDINHKILENDRAVLSKSINSWLTYNFTEKMDLLEIQDRFFKADQKKISERMNSLDLFAVVTMQFPEGVRFYDYLKLRREIAAYCQSYIANLLQMKVDLEHVSLKHPLKELRHLLTQVDVNQTEEVLLKLFVDITKILSADHQDAAAAFCKKQLTKIEAINFVPIAASEEKKIALTVGMK